MKTRSRAQQIVQTSILGVLLIGVALVFLSSSQGQRLLGGSSPMWSMWGSGGSEGQSPPYDEESDFSDYSDVQDELSLPACQDLREALGRLDNARTNLLVVAGSDDQQELEQAGEDYRTCVHDVQEGFSRLRSLVDPDIYECLVDELVSSREASGYWSTEQFLPEWQLGVLNKEIGE